MAMAALPFYPPSVPPRIPPYFSLLLPTANLHRTFLNQAFMHIEGLEKEVRLMAHPFLQAFVLGAVKVVLEDGPVIWVCALADDLAGTLSRRHASNVGQPLRKNISKSRLMVCRGAFAEFAVPVP
jgi:hypothetical protein